MTETTTKSAVRAILEDLLQQDLTGTGDVHRRDLPAWDSVKHLQIVLTVEDTFGVDLAGCALGDLDSLEGLAEAVVTRSS